MTFYVENEVDAEFPFDINKIVEDVAAAALNLEKCPYEIELNVLITEILHLLHSQRKKS